jgi:uncharacterized protein YndB with AHSA1/START domain
MPTNKDFKRLVRLRMQKTGEAYTAARAHLITRRPSRTAVTAAVAAVSPTRAPAPAEYASLAGMSDASVKKATGCTWERWVKALDHHRAYRWPHRDIAKFVRDKYQTPPWWNQMVVVGYERIKGLRETGQARGADYRITKSKVIATPLARLYGAFSRPHSRKRWLPGVDLTVRTATKDKSLRITWPDGSSVNAGFTSKGAAKSQVALEHGRLPDQAAATRLRAFWTERLGALADLLAPAAARAG